MGIIIADSDDGGDFMDSEAIARREKMLKLREKLLDIERERLAGAGYDTPEELDRAMTDAIRAAIERGVCV
ncbi:MAG: hypothetical protein IJG08_08010 [Oscillospiraceae bacterium]|nr:hypothetical protein [Oscillospiraceae bacterium]